MYDISKGWMQGGYLVMLTNSFTFNESLNTYAEGRKEMFYLTTHSTHFIYGYMASDMW